MLDLDPSDRLLVVLPHPDDESLACAGLLQHALAAGAGVRLLFATDGDNNPWAQRASERSLWITARDRARFGAIRRGEVLAALAALGLPGKAARFLAFPDQGLTALLMRAATHLLDDLRCEVTDFRPTVLVSPSMLDRHPDHSALGVCIAFVLNEIDYAPRHLRFFVHDPGQRRWSPEATILGLTEAELSRKRAAIDCHRTQQFWRGTWLRGFADVGEAFFEAEPPALQTHHPVRTLRSAEDGWEVVLASRSRLRSFGPSTLLLAGETGDRRAIRLSVGLWPPFGSLTVSDLTSGLTLGTARLHGTTRRGRLVMPGDLLPAGSTLYAKVEHAFGFFDEAGWKKV
ncbi:MAG TPA: PIG-L family deacetylase [Thermoanaerobaculaceae bacterium]|nr:PIG-L family deacetylase [Acidobacteriota bacterium]HPW55538.1 PIG-L family deacetylase [Thermoanaerobaculaceae bacterium]